MYECYVCGFSTKPKEEMISHINGEHKRTKKVAQKTPTSKPKDLEKPTTTESAKKRFHCSDCDASFARKAYLKKHQKAKGHGDEADGEQNDEGKMNLTFPLESKGKKDQFLVPTKNHWHLFRFLFQCKHPTLNAKVRHSNHFYIFRNISRAIGKTRKIVQMFGL